MKAKMATIVSLVLGLNSNILAAERCYFVPVRFAAIVDDGTKLKVVAEFPCSDESPAKQIKPEESTIWWVEDESDGKIGLVVQIPAHMCGFGYGFEKTIEYGVKEFNLKLPPKAYNDGAFKGLRFEEYVSAKKYFGLAPCEELKPRIYGDGLER